MTIRPWLWVAWAVALAAVVLGLGWQVADAEGHLDCLLDAEGQLIYCGGGLDPWVLPGSVALGLVLIGIGAWGILSRRD